VLFQRCSDPVNIRIAQNEHILPAHHSTSEL
jgi:hypothetical protein